MSKVSRRDFLKMTAGTTALLASGLAPAKAEAAAVLPPEAVGILYDATLCIGCKACMVKCKEYNSQPGGALYQEGRGIPYELPPTAPIWDAPTALSDKTVNLITAYRHGSGLNKDQAEEGFSFAKHHCMHCLDPACVSVCPVAAFIKDPKTGVVSYRKDRCIGCRYCQVACPFSIPKFEWSSASPQLRKCQLCHHRYSEGGYAACCEFCPTGASIFGRVTDLRQEAKRRLALEPGREYAFPVQRVDSGRTLTRPVSRYLDHVYGLNEAGGTQYLLLAGVSFDLLGFNPRITDESYSVLTWQYIAKVPALIAVLLAAGTASYYFTHRRRQDSGRDDQATG